MVTLTACTFHIQPAVPDPPPLAKNATLLNCRALLLVPEEFANREYISSFDGREIRLKAGPPAAKSLEMLIRSRVANVERIYAAGDGTLEFIRLSSDHRFNAPLILRPRFTRLESSVRGFRYNVEFGIALDVVGLSSLVTPSGTGVGSTSLYVQSEIQRAADTALSQAIASIAAAFPSSCR